MKPRFALMTIAALVALFAAPAMPAAEPYDVDGVHSTVIFRIKHIDVSYFYGRFDTISGSFTFDEANPGGSAFEVTIDAESVDTGAERRDNHVKSPDFLNAKQFPSITLTSKSVTKTGENRFQAVATLELHGVKKDVTVDLEQVGVGERGRFGFRRGFDARFTFKRSDYGMDLMLEGLGDEITIMAGIEGQRRDAEAPKE